jgi:hypothetical protein
MTCPKVSEARADPCRRLPGNALVGALAVVREGVEVEMAREAGLGILVPVPALEASETFSATFFFDPKIMYPPIFWQYH